MFHPWLNICGTDFQKRLICLNLLNSVEKYINTMVFTQARHFSRNIRILCICIMSFHHDDLEILNWFLRRLWDLCWQNHNISVQLEVKFSLIRVGNRIVGISVHLKIKHWTHYHWLSALVSYENISYFLSANKAYFSSIPFRIK